MGGNPEYSGFEGWVIARTCTWLSVMALAAGGCAGAEKSGSTDTDGVDPCAGLGDPSLALGTGTPFSPLADGADLGIVHGPQGGFHVYTSLQATGIVPGDPADVSNPYNPALSLSIATAGGTLYGGFDGFPRGFSDVGGGVFEHDDELLQLELADPATVDGERMTISATVEDFCGTVLHGELDVVLRDTASR